MRLNELGGCCGLREIHNLGDYGNEAEAAMKNMASMVFGGADLATYRTEDVYGVERGDKKWRFAIFTQASNGTYGDAFAKYIRDYNLGDLVETDVAVNPNSGNRLKVWVWTLDHEALEKWVEPYRIEVKPKVAKREIESAATFNEWVSRIAREGLPRARHVIGHPDVVDAYRDLVGEQLTDQFNQQNAFHTFIGGRRGR